MRAVRLDMLGRPIHVHHGERNKRLTSWRVFRCNAGEAGRVIHWAVAGAVKKERRLVQRRG